MCTNVHIPEIVLLEIPSNTEARNNTNWTNSPSETREGKTSQPDSWGQQHSDIKHITREEN